MDNACFDLDFGNWWCLYENFLDAGSQVAIYFFICYYGMAVIVFVPLQEAVSWKGIGLLLAGGLAYTIGAVIYGLKKPQLPIAGFGFHEIFHVFVMIGSACHIAFMFLYVL